MDGSRSRFASLLGRVFPWPLVATGHARLDAVASALVLGGLALSRLLVLPDGPWEQDEALISAGVVDFDPAHHLPLPPGFPLWVLLGRLVRLLGVSDPLSALQVASAVLSVLGVWALVGLWDGVAGRVVALSGAVLAAFLPGVWFHAARGFSETPASALAIVGLAFWMRGGAAGYAPGVLAVTAAALVRPPLAPFFVVIVLLATWRQRRRFGSIVATAAAAVALVLVVCLPLLGEAGGWRMAWSASAGHARDHLSGLSDIPLTLEGTGLVRGLGSVAAAGLLVALAAVGWWCWRRELGWRWWAGTAAGAWLVYLVTFLHTNLYPRYWVPVWLLLATPAVAGLAVLVRARAVAAGTAVLAAAWGAVWVWPAMWWVHTHPLPVVAALRAVAAEGAGVLVFEDQLFSFRDQAFVGRTLRVPSLRLSEIPPRRLNLAGRPIWFLTEATALDVTSPVSRVTELACAEPRVRRLSQERFLSARLVRNPVLAWRGVSVPEWESGERFMWAEDRALLLVPPLTAGGALGLVVDVHPELDGLPVEASVAGERTLQAILPAGRQVVRVPLPRLAARNRLNQVVPVELRSGRYVKVHGDLRKLSLRLLRATVEAPPFEAAPLELFPEPASLLAVAATAEGAWAPELIGNPPRPATWLKPRAVVRFTGGPGLVGVELLAPRPTPAEVEIRVGSVAARALVGQDPVELAVSIPDEPAWAHEVTLEITATPFVPGGGDSRVLGVAMSRLWYLPRSGAAARR